VNELAPEDLLKTPNGDHFVKAHKQKGILPEILEELLSARKRAKTDLKAATDPFMKAVLDGRQLALKVSWSCIFLERAHKDLVTNRAQQLASVISTSTIDALSLK